MKPHPHAELIKAWADGDEIQLLDANGTWIDFREGDTPAWNPAYKYRVKPQPKHNDIEYTTHIEYDFGWKWVSTTSTKQPNLKLNFDGETGKLKSAEVL